MKVRSTFFAFLLFTAITSWGQAEYGAVLELGISSSSKFDTGNNTETISPLFSGNFGGVVKFPISTKLNLQSGLYLNSLNYRQQILTADPDPSNIYSTGPTTTVRNYHLGYLSIPLGLNVELNKFYLTAGFRAGFGLIQRYDTHVSGELLNVPYDVTNKGLLLDAKRISVDYFFSLGRQISSKLSVSIIGYHSVMKVKLKNGTGFYNYQIGVGFNYSF